MTDPASAASAAAPASGGMPQFDPAPWAGEIFWSLVVFLVLYLLIARVFIPRVQGTIDDREDRIASDIGDARRLRDEAQADMNAAAAEMAQARAQAHKVAAEAAVEAKALAAARQAEEEARLGQALSAAEARIAEARAEAMGHVQAIALDAAHAMIVRLTGTEASRTEVEGALARVSAA